MRLKKIDMDKENPTLFNWNDATTHLRISLQKLKDTKDTRELMTQSKTIGYPIAQDKHGIIIVTEICGDEVDATIIPKKWIK